MIRRQLIAVAIALACVVAATPATARHQKHNNTGQVQEFCGDRYCGSNLTVAREVQSSRRGAYDGRVVAHPAGCPSRAFCGCGVSVKVFGKPIRDLFLARNWFKFPRATPGAGMVAVRNGHVMYIMAYDGNGNATVYDPNSGGHRTRIHIRSLAGYRVVNPHGARMASR